VLRLEEGWGPTTALREALLDATSASSANELLHWFYTDEWPRSRVAALSALVDSVASDGDSIARGIMESSAQVLAGLAGAVRRQLFSKGEPFRVAYVGGVFRSAWILERFRLLVELNERCTCSAPMLGPAEGALIEAFRAAGETVIPSGASKLQ
jgi:N-acetylglucosamine kinase-like BadF-type ATPase